LEELSLKNFLDNAWRQIREFFKNLDRRRRIIAAILAACVVTLAIVLSIALNRTNYELLYAGLSQEEAGAIYATLQDMGVDVKVRGTGTLLVPAERVSELRMTLSAAGYESGGFDYSILAEASGFSVSDLEQQEYAVYQKQEMLRATIRRSEKVADCLVLISPAVESPFMRPEEEKEASAAIMLETKNGDMLTSEDARAIASIAVNAVSGLRFENVSVVDAFLNVYLVDDDPQEGSETTNLTTQRLLETSVKHELESQVVNLLTPVFGIGKVKAMVSVALNFDDEKSEVIEFAPPVEGEDEGLIISMSELYENARADGAAGGVPGTDNNGMGAEEDIDGTLEYPYENELDEDETYRKILREMNLEINKSTTQIEKAKGSIRSLTIGVLLDALAVPEDYTENVRSLVAGAIGTSDGYVNVERMPFQEIETSAIADGVNAQAEAMNRYKMQELIQTGIICATALIFAILILALVRSLFKKPASVPLLAEAGAGGIDYIVGDDGVIPGIYGGEDVPPVGQQEEEGDVPVGAPPPETVVQLEKMIKSNPEAVATILRNWLTEEQ
jgi:flagellar M-ring protein FliF